MQLIIFLTGFLSGVALRSIIFIPQIFVTALIVAAVISICFYRKNIYLVFIIAAALGMLRFSYPERVFQIQSDEVLNNKEIEIAGIISEIPTESENNISAKTKTDSGNIILRFRKGIELEYGDNVNAKITCEIPKDFETSTGTIFNYKKYLMARNIHHICIVKSFEIISHNSGNYIQSRLYKLRIWFSSHIDDAIVNPHAGLVKGVLLGDKDGLTTELKSDMTVAGVIHIAVLSGSNIAIVAGIIFGLLASISYSLRIFFTVIIIVLFVLLSGAEPPAVRAGILVLIIFFGKFIHRKPHTGRVLLLAAFMMIMWNPFALIYDMSFQLSFLATIGIVYIAPIIKSYLNKVTERFSLREIISSTLGAQIAVTPLLLYSTGMLSIVSLPANILIGFAVPLLMMFGFFAGLLNIISHFIAMPVAFISLIISNYIIFITKTSAHFPYAQIFVTQ
jgi:competence protein ComEC